MKLNIDRLAARVKKRVPSRGDDSFSVLAHLALAYAAMQRLENKGVDTSFEGRSLVTPTIERAYREMLHIRKNLPNEMLDISVISKYGRLNESE